MTHNCIFYKKRKLLLFSCAAFLLVHLYKLVNYFPNWDSIQGIITSPLGTTTSGRWFSGIAEIITSSKYDLQWAGGLISAIFAGMTIVLIIDLLNIKNKAFQAVTIFLFAAFPSMAATLVYGFCSSGYMLGLFLAVSGIYICIRHTKYFYLSIPCFTLSIGIYQIYILFAATAAIYYFANLMLNPDEKIKKHKKPIVTSIISFLVSGILYLIINKIVLSAFNMSLTEYQGISDAGKITLSSFLNGVVRIEQKAEFFFLEGGFFKFYGFFNALILLFIIVLVFWKIIFNKNYSIPRRIILCIMFASAIPVTYSFYLISDGVEYHLLMELSNFFIYLIPILIFCNNKFKFSPKPLLVIISVLIGTMGVYHFINDNISYHQLHMSYERTSFQMTETLIKIDSVNDKKCKKIALIGRFPGLDDKISATPLITGARTHSFIISQHHFVNFAKYYMNREYTECTEEETEAITKTKEFSEMTTYPNGNYVSVINDTIVVKLSE